MGAETGELDHEDSVGPWPEEEDVSKRECCGQKDEDEGDGEEEDRVSCHERRV